MYAFTELLTYKVKRPRGYTRHPIVYHVYSTKLLIAARYVFALFSDSLLYAEKQKLSSKLVSGEQTLY